MDGYLTKFMKTTKQSTSWLSCANYYYKFAWSRALGESPPEPERKFLFGKTLKGKLYNALLQFFLQVTKIMENNFEYRCDPLRGIGVYGKKKMTLVKENERDPTLFSLLGLAFLLDSS